MYWPRSYADSLETKDPYSRPSPTEHREVDAVVVLVDEEVFLLLAPTGGFPLLPAAIRFALLGPAER